MSHYAYAIEVPPTTPTWPAATDEEARWLQRAALAEARLSAAEIEVQTLRQRYDRTLSLLADSERRRADAEHWLAEHRASLSWRATEPIRRLLRTGEIGRRRR